jgi:hypothetical protein
MVGTAARSREHKVDVRNVCGVHTIGSPRMLKLVLTITEQPDFSLKRFIRR